MNHGRILLKIIALHGIVENPGEDMYWVRVKKPPSSRYPNAILLATLILLFVPSNFPVLMGCEAWTTDSLNRQSLSVYPTSKVNLCFVYGSLKY